MRAKYLIDKVSLLTTREVGSLKPPAIQPPDYDERDKDRGLAIGPWPACVLHFDPVLKNEGPDLKRSLCRSALHLDGNTTALGISRIVV